MHTTVREATIEDLSRVLDLVKELAAFEKAADQVKVGLDDYIKGFQRNDYAVLLAIQDSNIVGMALYYLTWSTWRGRMLYLEDLIVTNEHRRQGIGNLLLESFIQRAHELRCNMVKWQVLDWNAPAIKFYEEKGATIEKDWWNVKIIF